MPPNHRVNECYLQFLEADMHLAGSGCLPAAEGSVASTRDGQLSGRFVLQADEAVDVGASFNDRYFEKPAKVDRTLKLSLTDGVTCVVAYEYRPIAQLGVHVPAEKIANSRRASETARSSSSRRTSPRSEESSNDSEAAWKTRGGREHSQTDQNSARAREASPNEAAEADRSRPRRRAVFRSRRRRRRPRRGCGRARGCRACRPKEIQVPRSVETAAEAGAAATRARARRDGVRARRRRSRRRRSQWKAAAPPAIEAPASSAAPNAAAAPDPAAEPAAPVGRIKRRRIVRIDDSDEDPTQTPKPPPTTRPSQPSRLGTRRILSAAAADEPCAHAVLCRCCRVGRSSCAPRTAATPSRTSPLASLFDARAPAQRRRAPQNAAGASRLDVRGGAPRDGATGACPSPRVQDGTGSMAAELAARRVSANSWARPTRSGGGWMSRRRGKSEGVLHEEVPDGFMGKVAAR